MFDAELKARSNIMQGMREIAIGRKNFALYDALYDNENDKLSSLRDVPKQKSFGNCAKASKLEPCKRFETIGQGISYQTMDLGSTDDGGHFAQITLLSMQNVIAEAWMIFSCDERATKANGLDLGSGFLGMSSVTINQYLLTQGQHVGVEIQENPNKTARNNLKEFSMKVQYFDDQGRYHPNKYLKENEQMGHLNVVNVHLVDDGIRKVIRLSRALNSCTLLIK
eukprot:scaffold10488_cov67-Cyclotella_meneghiniana.AAC.8